MLFSCRFSSCWQSTGLLIRGRRVQLPQTAPCGGRRVPRPRPMPPHRRLSLRGAMRWRCCIMRWKGCKQSQYLPMYQNVPVPTFQPKQRCLCIIHESQSGFDKKKKRPDFYESRRFYVMPPTGVEPVLCLQKGILSPSCLPISPQRRRKNCRLRERQFL